ncbi:MAG: DNA starvation/stationary phase protection protein [Verrucomicrobiota bacterium]
MKKKSERKAARKGDSEPVRIGIKPSGRAPIIESLMAILADQHVLYLKTRNFHWNLTGPRFSSLHEFFEAQYKGLELAIDETAERIRMIGGASPGSMSEFLKLASLKEHKGTLVSGDNAIKALKDDHETAVRTLRKAIADAGAADDVGTEDFLTGLIQAHEKSAWMLRSYLE